MTLQKKTSCCTLRRAKYTPQSFICKSHGKQEVDVQSFLPVEAKISVTKV